MQAYGDAWERADPDAAVAIFTEDATYQETPFDEPMRGRGAIHGYWSQIPRHHRDVAFGSEVLTEDPALVHWWVRYVAVATQTPTRLDGIFLLEFADDGRCSSLREWWHADPAPAF